MNVPITMLTLGLALALGLAGGRAARSQRADVPAATSATTKTMVLALHKARYIDLQDDARDVLVSNPEIADVIIKTARRVYLLAKKVGVANVFFFDQGGRQILRLELRVALDLTALRAAYADLMPHENIQVRAVNRTIVITGKVRSAATSDNARRLARRFVESDEDVINMLQLADDQQVLLQVHVSEMQRSVVKQLGINTTLGTRTPEFQLTSPDGAAEGTVFGVFVDFARIFGLGGALATANSFIDALEQEGLVKTLAQPNLTAISGETAKFLVGGEFPVSIPVGPDQPPAIEFKEFGILVTFTPVVLNSGLISLRIATELSRLSAEAAITVAGTTVQSLIVRRTETTVEIPSGGSLVIAGLLQNDDENSVRGLPFAKDIPILGALFRSVAFERRETELVIMVSPYIIRPVMNTALALPTDGFAPASDVDLYLLGRLHGVYLPPALPPQQPSLKGPIGYIME